MEYIKNKNIQITFTIKEDLYFRFKTFCKAEKKTPAAVLKEFIKKYVEERENENNEEEKNYVD
ncbi:hypothetical protein DW815_00345 [Ruminococcus sp. AM33-14]|nr:hypothetical protein DW815_00345 [Ruminococcus sp. AM33-14]